MKSLSGAVELGDGCVRTFCVETQSDENLAEAPKRRQPCIGIVRCSMHSIRASIRALNARMQLSVLASVWCLSVFRAYALSNSDCADVGAAVGATVGAFLGAGCTEMSACFCCDSSGLCAMHTYIHKCMLAVCAGHKFAWACAVCTLFRRLPAAIGVAPTVSRSEVPVHGSQGSHCNRRASCARRVRGRIRQ